MTGPATGPVARTGVAGPVRVPSALTAPLNAPPCPAADDPAADGSVVGCVVLGAGCSGLATALALAERDDIGPIVLVDGREEYADDRTWSFWQVEPTPFDACITGRWETWAVRTADGTTTVTADPTPYVSIRAADYYREALHRLSAHPLVRLQLGRSVIATEPRGPLTAVLTDVGALLARRVIDARGPRPAPQTTGAEPVFGQRFLGIRVRSDRPVFDPSTATLMDFDVDQTRGIHFVYVLPTSPTEALIEDTYLTADIVEGTVLQDGVADYLHRRYGLTSDDYETVGTERGVIPMRTPSPSEQATDAVGARGRAVRPSTGYAFLRIHRAASTLGSGGGRTAAPAVGDALRTRILDAVFLRFLQTRPDLAPTVFQRMFARTPPATLVRFLTERSSWLDEVRLVLALPKRPFLMAFLHLLAHRRANHNPSPAEPYRR